MPKKRLKTDHCLNCGKLFENDENFCPRCGQENSLKVKPLNAILKDFLDDLWQIDSRFARSVIPFLFQPGKLTNEYAKGRRKHYVTPIRIYLVFSFLYFFIFSIFISDTFNTNIMDKDKENRTNRELLQFDVESFSKELRKDSTKILALKKRLANKKYDDEEDSLNLVNTLNKIISRDSLIRTDTVKARKLIEKERFEDNEANVLGINVNKVIWLYTKKRLNEEQILDTMGLEKNFMNRMLVRQGIRWGNMTPRDIVVSVVDKVPITMFLLIPIFAFFLKIIYFRSKRHYIEHLIFGLHIHAFAFFIFTTMVILTFWLGAEAENIAWLILLLLIYGYLAFKNVYKQNWFKTFLKASFVGFAYLIVLTIGLSIGILVSLLFI
ncbi:MAG: DUF3667 domain-containing protein [Cytophagales bacterium]|nr:MAG: DUF3667 domain-containing protein [Cytophagales bacterium]